VKILYTAKIQKNEKRRQDNRNTDEAVLHVLDNACFCNIKTGNARFAALLTTLRFARLSAAFIFSLSFALKIVSAKFFISLRPVFMLAACQC
jgi:hypothetical protein